MDTNNGMIIFERSRRKHMWGGTVMRQMHGIAVEVLGTIFCLASMGLRTAVANPPVDDPAVLFLKSSMDRYKSLDALDLEYKWSESFGPGSDVSSTRTFSYAKPNRWKVVTTTSWGPIMTSVS